MAVVAVDAHCHADMLMQNESHFPVGYRELGLAGITWSYTETVDSWRDFPPYWDSVRQLSRTLIRQGIPFFYMVGIHPRSIPSDLRERADLPEELTEAMAHHMEEPLCLGLGETGLDSGDSVEEKVLTWQLDWASQSLPSGKRIGIHTPRRNKERVTRQTLILLQNDTGLRSRILLDHVSPQTLPLVRDAGYRMGITLQDGKTSVSELLDVLREDPEIVHHVHLNSDGAKSLSAPYLAFVQASDLVDPEIKRALLLENVFRFFGISSDLMDNQPHHV